MTDMKQPEALRLAEVIEDYVECTEFDSEQAATELRRQHAEIESLQDDLAHKDQFAEQLGRELAKADSEAKELRAKLDKTTAAIKAISNDNWPDADLNAGEFANLVLHELAAGARPVESVQKLRPDFIAGYDAGMADAKRIQAAGARPVEPAPVQVTKPNICTDCSNADSWGLPDKPCCRSCVSGNNWQSLNTSSVNPNGPAQPAPAAKPVEAQQPGMAPATLPDERATFEAWISKDGGDLSTFGSGRNIHYSNSAVNNAWTGWKARASHWQAPAQPAPAAQDDAKDAARWRYAVEIGGNQRMNWLDVYDDWDGDGSFADAIDAARAADIFGDVPQPSQEPPPIKPMCCRCLDESDDLFPANCSEKPELLTGAPLGMYHCPDCGAMVCAGFPHGPLCQTCHDRKHPGFDCDNTSAADKKEPT